MNVRAPMNVRAIVAWTLYDFANSSFAAVIFATVYSVYYAQAVVGNASGARSLKRLTLLFLR